MGLRFFPPVASGGRIACVANSDISLQKREFLFVEHLVYESEILVNENGLTISHSYARAFLATVLQGLEPETCQTRHIFSRSIYAEDSARLFKPIGFFVV